MRSHIAAPVEFEIWTGLRRRMRTLGLPIRNCRNQSEICKVVSSQRKAPRPPLNWWNQYFATPSRVPRQGLVTSYFNSSTSEERVMNYCACYILVSFWILHHSKKPKEFDNDMKMEWVRKLGNCHFQNDVTKHAKCYEVS